MRLTSSRLIVLAMAFVIALSLPVSAENPKVSLKIQGDQLSWTATTPYQGATLSVSTPDGSVFERTFSDSEVLTVSASALTAGVLTDGGYAWQLTLMPVIDSDTRKAMENARESEKSSAIDQLRADGHLPIDGTLVSSGYFRVSHGKLIDPARSVEPEPAFPEKIQESAVDRDEPTRDQVILDDLIVDGSACIGFDCVNGESFGFDTIRIKENNLRIKAQDTSTSASFPTNDWQITFNETANGGANKFSIDDIDGGRTPFTIEAGAPSHSLYVDDGGRIGFGTNTPVVDLHVKSGNTPTLRLEQDGSSGFAAQTWDVAANETNFFIRDATNGSTLPFRIFPGAPSNAITIEAGTGDVGIGTTSPDREIDIEGDGAGFRITNTGSGGSHWDVTVNSAQGRLNFQVNDGNIPVKIDDGADNNLLQVGIAAANEVRVNGNIVATGTITPDFVFESDYDLPSIEEQAILMWGNKHLPAVTPATPDGRGTHAVNLGRRSEGMLEELEKAHIYIDQLNQRIKRLEEIILSAQAEK